MIDLYKPYMPKDMPELNNILYSGLLSYGKWGKIFENELRKYIGNELLLTTNSYMSSIYLALTLLDLEPGDEVIASPMSCLASNMPLHTFGLKIVWADIDIQTGTLSPDEVRKKISKNTKLIFHTHFCGYIGYVDEINQIAKNNSIFVIDDCVEAFGSEYKGKKAGNLDTDISIFSFQSVRLPNTIDGGAISFNNNYLFEKAILMRDFGICRSKFRDTNGEINPECDISMKGYGATLNEVNSYIGCCVMDDIHSLLQKQRYNALAWKNKGVDCSLDRDEINPNFWVYGTHQDNKIKSMHYFKNKGLNCSSVHLPNNFYSIFSDNNHLKGVDYFYNHFLALPCGWWV